MTLDQDDVQKRLAQASAVARQHIALGLAPQHTRALRVLPTYTTQCKASNAAMDEQTKSMAQVLQEQARQITAQQDLLQQMLHNSLRSSATQSPTSSPSTVCSHLPTAKQSCMKPPRTAQPKDSVAAAPEHAPSRRQSSGLSAEDPSMLPLDPCQGAQMARGGVSGPASSRSKAAASAEEAGAATGKHAVSVVAKPELYSALTAAVSAIVQQAGLAPCQRSDCSQGISLQYHAEGGGLQVEGQGAADERQGAQPEGQGAQLNGQGAQLRRQGAQVEGQTEGVRRQPTCPEGQHAGHERQQQDSSSAALATVSATSPPTHMASQHSCGQAHDGQVSVHHDVSVDNQTRSQVAGGSGGVQAWQAQIAQAMQVLQAALQTQSSCKTEEPPAVVLSRPPSAVAQQAEQSTPGLNANQQRSSLATDTSWPQAWPEIHEQNIKPLRDQSSCKEAPVYDAHASHGPALVDRLMQHSAAPAAGGLRQQQGEGAPGGVPGGVHRGGYGLSAVRADTPTQQSCQPSRNADGESCLDGTWQKHDCRDDTWQKHDSRNDTWQKPKGPASATQTQRRLYKHGPVVPKSSAMQRPIRRRQRPEWNDHLTSVTPRTERGEPFPEEEWGGPSCRPTAKELLQEALARIQAASNSPRPQHAKRQRRGTAPQHGQPGPATPQPPQLQSGRSSTGGGQMGHGHSCGIDATGAQGFRDAQRQPGLTGQPDKQSLVKQPMFGGKPSWVCQSSAGVIAEHSTKAGKSATAALPQFADADKAQAWQKLTHLQQHMLGLITAVETQLSLSDSPKSAHEHQLPKSAREHHSPHSAREHRAAGAAEQPADALHSGVKTQQQQEQKEPCVVTSVDDQQPQGREMPEQLQTHTVDAEITADEQRQKPAGDEESCDTPLVGEGAEAATDECPQQGQQQLCVVRADQQMLSEVHQPPPKAGALSDGDVQRVLAHRRAYLKQQRAFDRACMGSDEAFDPTLVVESIADMLLEDVLQQCAAELGQACDSFAEELFDSEFVI